MKRSGPRELPLVRTETPGSIDELASIVRDAHAARTPVYPIGGATALGYGAAAPRPGIGISLAGLGGVVEHAARDMTVTVQPGLAMARLAALLAAERQQIPVDVALPERATLGGAVATAADGARRYGFGRLRDSVIGIRAVDGRGVCFRAGGRVVKNVAGYDFCKLLCGSLGTLGVVVEVTLKTRPVPARSLFVVAEIADVEQLEPVLAALSTSGARPVAIEVLGGAAWRDDPSFGGEMARGSVRLAVGLEGTDAEVAWMASRLGAEWRARGLSARLVEGEAAATAWRRLADFSAAAPDAVVAQANVLPSRVAETIAMLCAVDRTASIVAHAGHGAVVARLGAMGTAALRALLDERLRPSIGRAGGSVVVLSAPSDVERDRALVFGPPRPEWPLMERTRRAFDPAGILNPGRFVHDAEPS